MVGPEIYGSTPSDSSENREHLQSWGGGRKPIAGEELGSGDRQIWVQILALPPPSSVLLARLLNLSKAFSLSVNW